MGLRGLFLVLVSLVLAGSVAARALLPDDGGTGGPGLYETTGKQNGGSSFLPDLASKQDGGGYDGDAADPSPIEKAIPYLTEGSFFALIGFAVGYTTRKLVKMLLILLALAFLLIQGLSHLEIVAVDWDKALGAVNELILNIKQDQTFTQFLKDRIPTAGGLLAGFAVGYRRG